MHIPRWGYKRIIQTGLVKLLECFSTCGIFREILPFPVSQTYLLIQKWPFIEFSIDVRVHFCYISRTTGFKLTVHNSLFAKCFSSLRMSFCIFSKNCESLKSDTLWIFRLINWNSYILSYFKPIKYLLFNNNMISQRFIVHKIHTSFFSSYILWQSSKL